MPARNVVLRPAAEDDLTDIYHYIAEQSGYPQRAIDYIRRLRAACEALAHFPERGHRRDDLRPGVRIIGLERRAVIVYTILETGDIEIGRILYGGQDYETLLRDEEA